MTVNELINKLNEIQDKNLEVFCEPYIPLDLLFEEKQKFFGNASQAYKIKEVACTEFRETKKLWVALITNPYSEDLLKSDDDIFELDIEQ